MIRPRFAELRCSIYCAVSTALFAVACSDSPRSATDAGASDAGTTVGSADAGSETSAPPSSAGKFDYGYRPSTGILTLIFTLNGDFAFTEAEFVKTRKDDPSVRREEGGCLEVTGSATPNGQLVDGDVERGLPGAVTVSGGEPPYTKTFTPTATDPLSFRVRDLDPGIHFLGGEDVRFSSTGADLPAFDVHQSMPLVLRLVEADPKPGPPIRISRTQDFDLAWTRGTSGVDLYFLATDYDSENPTRAHYLTCRFDSLAGKATIPKNLLAFNSKSFVRIFSASYRTVTIGGFETEVRTMTSVYHAAPNNRGVLLEFE